MHKNYIQGKYQTKINWPAAARNINSMQIETYIKSSEQHLKLTSYDIIHTTACSGTSGGEKAGGGEEMGEYFIAEI